MLAISPRSSLKVTANAVLDLASALRGKPPRRIPIAGPEHSTALMTAPDAMPGYLGLVADGTTFRNEAAARIALHIPSYRPWRRAKDIACPVLFSICETDSVAPPGPTKKAARLAPHGESQVYAAGHFEIYTGEAFEEAIGDQLEFLGRHVPTRRTG
jgi:pimeloyl-ACP methyl ester carboxylesterase